ncbi:alkaline shock response membrane anchor protein AmaP [Melissococcus plutonius]|uniref:Alkaline shock response membrane anchor protein AmaP n=1 Tax=Melissococcus plutonius (strain ATCC 35311 / DSM 29964 / CIP 104052 / LMG 20360 / NCIMB 702443) TaxID=940190 RepID=F3YAW2_MELPT|nr:alkaline shock response membrane anchor protein AmaP [Melissococcus plutonius]AIM25816.1 hypothetical protein MEPL_c011380 [Melissococcus plutonius S1]KMT25321.1 hypothetical protein MEPL2_2c08850 [Melissococcus plutonius]KMT26226.1 hypothetical protein MEPL3_3c01580 [Melissococcus plutonius]KMT26956.1 hypothetical protein MEPL1_4c01580 [Melissococcus plutonius]KMT28967.1 hypothetical protein MEPL4_4c01560 [Melissococcus plutonius]
MRKVIKTVISLILFVALCVTIGLLSQLIKIPWLSETVNDWAIRYSFISIIFKGILLFLGAFLFILLLTLIALPRQKSQLVFKRKTGTIEIPKKTIEKIIRESYSSIIGPEKTKLRVKIKGKKSLDVYVYLFVHNKENYTDMVEEIRQKIEQTLLNALETTAIRVNVHLKEKEMQPAMNKKESRVI